MSLDPSITPTPLRSATGRGQPYPAEVVAGVRGLVVAGLSYREAAARAGLREDTVGRWARRFGWRGADGAAAIAKDIPQRRHAEERLQAASRSTHNGRASFETPAARAPQDDEVGSFPPASSACGRVRPPRKGEGGRDGYGPELREAARARVEGTRDGLERIALDLGIERRTVHRWRKLHGWQRPAPPDKRGPDFYRARRLGRPYGADAVGMARDLVRRSKLPMHRIAAQAGISRATLYRWMKRPGWERDPALARSGSRVPYGEAVVARAGELFRTTNLSVALIAARARTTPERVGHWARTRGWTRPRDEWHAGGRPRERASRHRRWRG